MTSTAMIKRDPYRPEQSEWQEIFLMLCGHCAHFSSCQVVEGMIEMKDGGEWPAGGWVTDPGAGVTCLSYETKPIKPLSHDELNALLEEKHPTCQGCAARHGSEASVSMHTRRDFKAAVKSRGLFVCHEDPDENRPCGGWCSAVYRQIGRSL